MRQIATAILLWVSMLIITASVYNWIRVDGASALSIAENTSGPLQNMSAPSDPQIVYVQQPDDLGASIREWGLFLFGALGLLLSLYLGVREDRDVKDRLTRIETHLFDEDA